MPAQIIPFQDSPAARAELAPFLMRHFQGEGACDIAQWLRRFAFWWDENPFAHAHPCRGWLLRDAEDIVGYLGVIPTFYEDAHGRPVPALIATSWAVAEPCRNSAMPMGLLLQRAGQQGCVLVDTTPSPEVRRLLARWGWEPQSVVRHSLLARGSPGAILAALGGHVPGVPREGRRIVSDPALVSHIAASSPPGRMQKHVTPGYLRWYLHSPMREHHFLGVIDDGGTLSSYLMMTGRRIRGLPAWMIIDWFTTESTTEELHALVCHLMHSRTDAHEGWKPLISLMSFPAEPVWEGLPILFSRDEVVCHHHWLPPDLKESPVRHVMSEGDWGL